MNIVNLLFAICSTLCLISMGPMFRALWKDRDVLRGYSPSGCLLTVIALLCALSAYGLMENWVSILTSIPSFVYWCLAFWFSWRR